MWFRTLVSILFLAAYFVAVIHSEEEEEDNPFFLKAEKNIPRIGRATDEEKKQRNDEFERFFLKASKSVPRIGRRNEIQKYGSKMRNLPYSMGGILGVHGGEKAKLPVPTWSNIADTFEYHPDILTTPELMARLEEEMGDDPSVYDWDKIRFKRTVGKTNNYM